MQTAPTHSKCGSIECVWAWCPVLHACWYVHRLGCLTCTTVYHHTAIVYHSQPSHHHHITISTYPLSHRVTSRATAVLTSSLLTSSLAAQPTEHWAWQLHTNGVSYSYKLRMVAVLGDQSAVSLHDWPPCCIATHANVILGTLHMWPHSRHGQVNQS